MKTTILLNAYYDECRSVFKNKTPNPVCAQWQGHPHLFHLVLLRSLFEELPTLEHVRVLRLGGGTIPIRINHSRMPALSIANSDLFKSWLIEVDLKQIELDLILRCAPFMGIGESFVNEITRHEFGGSQYELP